MPGESDLNVSAMLGMKGMLEKKNWNIGKEFTPKIWQEISSACI